MKGLRPYASISQPRYLPAINYLQRIYHSDFFILLDDCQHQRRAFEHRNKIIRPQGSLQRESQWLSLNIDKSTGSRPLIKDAKLVSLSSNLLKHAAIVQKVYGKKSLAYKAFMQTCIDVAARQEQDHLLASFCFFQITEIFRFLGISLSTKIIRSSEVNGNGVGSSRILECCLEIGAKTYLSGPNGKEYLASKDFLLNNIDILYHDFDFPEYSQVGAGYFLPWMAWIDMLDSMGKEGVACLVLAPPSFDCL